MNYIFTGTSTITVEQMIEVLSNIEDKKSKIYIRDDNDRTRPVTDIAHENGQIIICDF